MSILVQLTSVLPEALKFAAIGGAFAFIATATQIAIVALTTPRLRPAPGALRGRVPARIDKKDPKPLRLLVFGDSVAAGVGCPSNEEAFAGSAARGLAQVSGRPVQWDIVARSGYTAAKMHARLVPQLLGRAADVVSETLKCPVNPVGNVVLGAKYDVCLISVGVNHVLSAHSPTTYQHELEILLTSLRDALGDHCALVVLGMPPMAEFPAIARHVPLSWLVHWYSRALHSATERACKSQAVLFDFPNLEKAFADAMSAGTTGRVSVSSVVDKAEFTRQCMAPDGFHPSATAISLVARDMAETCLREISRLTGE